MIRAEVRDLRRRICRSRDGEAGGSLTREVPGRVGAAPTKPGRASTARWCGFGERDGVEHARNQREYVPRKVNRLEIWRIWAGRGAHLSRARRGGELPGRLVGVGSGGHGETAAG